MDKKIPTALTKACGAHGVPEGVPCYHIPPAFPRLKRGGGYFAGVCDKRARRAGFTAPISPQSLGHTVSRH